jgi:hypothetical protein
MQATPPAKTLCGHLPPRLSQGPRAPVVSYSTRAHRVAQMQGRFEADAASRNASSFNSRGGLVFLHANLACRAASAALGSAEGHRVRPKGMGLRGLRALNVK